MSTTTNENNSTVGGSNSNATTTAKAAKKIANSLNPEKLKQYLITSSEQDINSTAINQKAASRNQAEGTLTVSHRNLHTVGHMMMKQSSLNTRLGTADVETRKQNITFSTQSKTIGVKTVAGTDVRSSIKNGSKRRANSNHTADKKVNLDKFLSVVQQRSNYTPSSQVNGGRMAPQGVAHLYKASQEKKSTPAAVSHYNNNTNLTMNQSRNIERKKIG